MKSKKIIITVCMLIAVLCSYSQTVTLTPGNQHIKVNKMGTVTFSGPGITLEEIAIKEGLTHKGGRTYSAAIIYDAAFSNGRLLKRGKIFNCTDNVLNITCSFYNGSSLIGSYNVVVKPRTFSRMVPDDASFSTVASSNKIVCSESGIPVGRVDKSNKNYGEGGSSGSDMNNSSSIYFTRETTFYGENSTDRRSEIYRPDGSCICIGYVNDDGAWIRGTSEGQYYIKNGTIYVRWDDWLDETRNLSGNSYYVGNLRLIMKR